MNKHFWEGQQNSMLPCGRFCVCTQQSVRYILMCVCVCIGQIERMEEKEKERKNIIIEEGGILFRITLDYRL